MTGSPYPYDVKGGYYVVFRPHKRLSSTEAYKEYDETKVPFEQQARAKAPQLEQIFIHFPDAKISGKGPTAFIHRNYPLNKTEEVSLHILSSHWDRDIFVCGPVARRIE